MSVTERLMLELKLINVNQHFLKSQQNQRRRVSGRRINTSEELLFHISLSCRRLRHRCRSCYVTGRVRGWSHIVPTPSKGNETEAAGSKPALMQFGSD